MLRKFLIVSCLFFASVLYSTAPALAVEVGVGEPYAWGSDDQFGTKEAMARTGMDRMQELGISWHHEWISWKDWQPTRPGDGQSGLDPGAISLLDKVEAMGRQRGITTYGMLYNSPSWANGNSNSIFIPGNGDPNNPEFQKFVEDYGNFVYDVVGRYKGRIDYWEIWSEPDWNWITGDQTSIQQRAVGYTYMLKTAYRRAKEANPDSVIIMGGPIALWSDQYISTVYANGGGPFFDRANLHPYTNNQKPSLSWVFAKIGIVRQIMDANGDTAKPIWITEAGWTTTGDSSWKLTESQQGDYMIDALETVKTRYPSVEVFTLFRVMDRAWYSSSDKESGFGLLYSDKYGDGVPTGHYLYEPKPSFQKLKTYLETNTTVNLRLGSQNSYWSSYSDYLSRNMSNDFTITNTGNGAVRGVNIDGVDLSNGVDVAQELPLPIGDFSPGGATTFTMKYYIPSGVTSFRVYMRGSGIDNAGNVYNFPN
ncbi:MAG: hypothetical protein HZB44_07115 [Actinobacteria bacterium]|nr:hypothetical protein [Actinomycetota bacterium]